MAGDIDLSNLPPPAPDALVDPGPVTRHERVYARMVRMASTWRGQVVLFVWAFFEAMVWPLIPDSALMGMVFASRARAGRMLASAVSGSVVGGLVGVAAARAGATWPLPLVTLRMREAAAGWLAEHGAAGLWFQPLSGVPYKAFVQAAGREPVNAALFAAHTLAARGARMLLLALLAAGSAHLLSRLVPPHRYPAAHVAVVASVTVMLFGGIAVVLMLWS